MQFGINYTQWLYSLILALTEKKSLNLRYNMYLELSTDIIAYIISLLGSFFH